MANISVERDGLADGMPRDERGYWKPDKDFSLPNPVFTFPPNPKAIAKWLKGYLFPVNFLLMGRGHADLALPHARNGAHEGI